MILIPVTGQAKKTTFLSNSSNISIARFTCLHDSGLLLFSAATVAPT